MFKLLRIRCGGLTFYHRLHIAFIGVDVVKCNEQLTCRQWGSLRTARLRTQQPANTATSLRAYEKGVLRGQPIEDFFHDDRVEFDKLRKSRDDLLLAEAS